MATLKQEFIFFNDAFGNIQPSTKIFAYEAGSTTPKKTYMDVGLQNDNTFPVVADGAGIFGPIFLEAGGYRIIVRDKDNALLQDRDNINVSETTILSTSDFYFSTLVDLKQGIPINGGSVNLVVGQVAQTIGEVTITDNLGAGWLIVAGGTGTADDVDFVDLGNLLQGQRLKNFTEEARTEADKLAVRTNIDVNSTAEADTKFLPAAVAGFNSANSVYTTDDITVGSAFQCSSSLASESVWESVGPTGSGADNIWTALDSITTGFTFIDVIIECINTSGGSALGVDVHSRSVGSVAAVNALSRIASIGNAATSVNINYRSPARIAANGDGSFEILYSSDTGTGDALLYLRGFGI